MSLEQVITDHAAAIRELAAAIRGAASSNIGSVLLTADTIEADVSKVEADAKAKQAAVMKQVEADRKSTPKEDIKAVMDKAAAEKLKADEVKPLPAEPLDWAKEVRPVLLKVGAPPHRDELVALLAKYEIPAGGVADEDKRPALLAEANAILAARG